ncbi:MAG: phosphatase PAP2 family protein [Gemmatimonadales bacterium]
MEAPAPEPLPAHPESQRLLTVELLLGLLIAAAALVLFTWLGREVLEGEVLAFDERLRALVHSAASPRLTVLMRAASLYGGPTVLIAAGVVAAVAFIIKGWRRGALLVVVTLAGASVLNGLLKFSFARVRPAAFFDYPLPGSPSFPSGHALYAAGVFGGVAVLLSSRLHSLPLQIGIWLVSISLILLVGISRVYLGVHYPSDVLAGYTIGTIWVIAVALGDRLMRHRRRSS